MQQQKILVVEDEPSIADNITYALSTEGYLPQCAATAKEAWEQLERQPEIALIILDVGLPDENGFEVAKQIRQKFDVPIIFVTARSDEIDRVVGLEIGADDYVVKPFSPRELTARVRAVLRRTAGRTVGGAAGGTVGGAAEAAPAASRAFQIDEARYRITFHGRPLDLSRYEFRILSILIKSPGRVYSRAQLMQLAWEDPDMSLERTVDTHMKTIRQKLKSITDEDPIVTHRGIGYSLREDL